MSSAYHSSRMKSWEVVRAYFDGKFSRPRRRASEQLLLAKIGQQQLRIDDLKGRLPQLRVSGRLGE